MFYSSHSESITKPNPNHIHHGLMDSSLKGSQIFNGNYWDDFPLPLLLNANAQSVLMLGVGYGAGLRPLLATNPSLKITGVDLDDEGNEACRNIFQTSFGYTPHLITADALTHLEHTDELYDLIWVDLYDHQGLAPVTLNPFFWQTVSRRLTPNGSVAINVFGIANHLEAYVDDSPLKVMAHLISSHFSRLIAAPHRRNTTLIGSNSIARPFNEISTHHLHSSDHLTLRLLLERTHHLQQSRIGAHTIAFENQNSFTFDRLNELQQKAWGAFLYDLNHQAGPIIQTRFMSPRALVEYLRHEATGPRLLDALRHLKSDLITMVPTFLGADIHNHSQSLDWYFDYLVENAKQIERESPHHWHNYFLPQWASMLNSRDFLRLRLMTDLTPLLGALS